jgi:fructosamine-3-kinase
MEIIKSIISKDMGWNIQKTQVSTVKMGDVNSSYIATFEEKTVFIKVQDKENLPKFYSSYYRLWKRFGST